MHTRDETGKGAALHSWKEIAACLGVTVRSAQRWEQSDGLPVYRDGTGGKARVFAYTNELLSWRDSRTVAVQKVQATYRVRRIIAFAALVSVLIGLAWMVTRRHPPADWHVDRTTLQILDKGGNLLWSRQLPGLSPNYAQEAGDKVVIADLDGDGRSEVLVNFISGDPASLSGSLYCFDDRGRLRWQTPYGAPRTIHGRTFTQSYKGRFVRVVKDASGAKRILTVANHYLWYPSQTALVDPSSGRMIEEYWHPGSVYHCLFADVDNDHHEEVLLAAINNPGQGLGHAALAVLKLPFSQSPLRKPDPADPLSPYLGGREFAYALFPQPDVNRVMGTLPIITDLTIDQGRRIVVQIPIPEGNDVYYLSLKLAALEQRFSDNLASLHNRLHHQGLLDHPLSTAEIAALGKVVTFPSAPDGNRPELNRFWTF